MSDAQSGERDRFLNGAELRVLGGLLVGIGIAPIVVGALVYPVDRWIGGDIATIVGFAINLLAAVFGLVALHVVRLFYVGDWRSLDGAE